MFRFFIETVSGDLKKNSFSCQSCAFHLVIFMKIKLIQPQKDRSSYKKYFPRHIWSFPDQFCSFPLQKKLYEKDNLNTLHCCSSFVCL